MVDWKEQVDKVSDKEDFVRFVGLLVADLKSNPSEWTNRTLADYLEGIAGWVGDMEGYYKNNNIPVPEDVNWKVVADLLMAARVYE